MSERSPLELDAETMRRLGYRVIDLLVERHARLGEQPAWRGADAAAMRARLGDEDPSRPASFEELLDRLTHDVLPWAGAIDHPRFFAFVPSSPTWPAVLGDLLAAGQNVFAGTWIESAGPSALELQVLGWFKDWIGYPASAAGLLVSGGSVANLTALACARLTVLGDRFGDAVIYHTDETHSSLERAARVLGFREDQLRRVPADDARMSVAALADAVADDRAAGRRPFLVAANAGATSTGVVDPLRELASSCREHGLWLHADAAYGGFAVLTAAGRRLLDGLGEADSVTLDPHKWLFQPYEVGCLLVRDGRRLEDAFRVVPAYLQDTRVEHAAAPDLGDVNFADRGLQLTRAARAFKIWLTVRHFGLGAIAAAIERAMELARHAQARIETSSSLELLAPAALGVVCFRRRVDGDEAAHERTNAALVRRLAESGLGMISSTRVRGRYALRLCILNYRSTSDDVDAVLDRLASDDPA